MFRYRRSKFREFRSPVSGSQDRQWQCRRLDAAALLPTG
jgi:hypothetical protein